MNSLNHLAIAQEATQRAISSAGYAVIIVTMMGRAPKAMTAIRDVGIEVDGYCKPLGSCSEGTMDSSIHRIFCLLLQRIQDDK